MNATVAATKKQPAAKAKTRAKVSFADPVVAAVVNGAKADVSKKAAAAKVPVQQELITGEESILKISGGKVAYEIQVPREMLDPHEKKQINLLLPISEHYLIKTFVSHRVGKKVSMQEFIMQAVKEKMEREGVKVL